MEVDDKIINSLNEDQKNAFKDLVDFISDEDREYTVVIGYAGTGKTYLIRKFAKVFKDKKIAMTAPTNKATKILSEEAVDGVEYATIHKLLGLRLKWMYPKDKEPYQKLVSVYNKNGNSIDNYDIIIIDEVSMLSDEVFNILVSRKRKWQKIIFLGDPAQIPPVNQLDSIPLLKNGQKKYNIVVNRLERIMRQKAGNPILEVAYRIRDKRFNSGDIIKDLRHSSLNLLFLSSNTVEDMTVFNEEVKNHFLSREFKNDSSYCKLLAWTNATVDAYNTFIRRNLFGTEALTNPYIVGEKLIADSPVGDGEEVGIFIYNTSDEFEILEIKMNSMKWDYPVKNKNIENSKNLFGENNKPYILLKYYDVLTKGEFGNEARIKILDESSYRDLSKIISILLANKMFKEFEIIKDKFAKVKYNYAITVHKSQGSTYNTVFIVEDDIDKNRKDIERNRIKYTALTRASHRAFVLSSCNKPFGENIK